MEKILQKFGL